MNSQERVLAALNLEEPDRVPIGEIGYDINSISSALGIPTSEERIDRRRNIRKEIEILSRFIESLDLDIVPARPSPPEGGLRIKKIDEKTWIDEWGAKYQYRDGIE